MSLFLPVQTADGSYSLKDPQTGETYHSLAGALSEARNLYVLASGFDKKLAEQKVFEPIKVLDIGLGLGYNALSTIDAFLNQTTDVSTFNKKRLSLTSLEINRDLLEVFLTGKGPWQCNWQSLWCDTVASLKAVSENQWLFDDESLRWSIHLKDFSKDGEDLPDDNFDFIWQDPFSPKKAPHLWSASWFEKLYVATKPNGVLMTYSVASSVRAALKESGWLAEKIPGLGHKRSWLFARKPA